MSHPVLTKLDAIRRRARQLWLLFGLSAVLAGVLVTTLVCILCDYLFRFSHPLTRLACTGLVLGMLAWSTWRFLLPSLWTPLSDLDVALRIQKRYPRLRETLSSSVEFLRQGEHDPGAGSVALRRAVIARATAELADVQPTDVLEPRSVWTALGIAGGMLGLALLLAGLNPGLTRIALTRLLVPWSTPSWPRVNHLEFVAPVSRVARGLPLEFRVQDAKGRLPREVTFYYQPREASAGPAQVAVMQPADKGIVFFRLEAATGAFAYRAQGGDDESLPWQEVTVVDPPEITSLQATVTPPAYTALPPSVSDPQIRALTGSRIRWTGASSKALRSVTFRAEGSPDLAAEIVDLPSGPRRGFEVEFDLARSGRYGWQLVDQEGFLGGDEQRYNLQALPDEPPTVVLEQPSTHLAVTAQAIVPLRLLARDDLALKNVVLHYDRPATPAPQKLEPEKSPADSGSQITHAEIALWSGPESLSSLARENPSAGPRSSLEQRIVHEWDLAQMQPPLAPGMELVFHVAASDYVPQVGQSPPRKLTIVTPEQLADRLAGRQAAILEELKRMAQIQTEARAQTKAAEIQWDTVGTFARADRDQLQAAELKQRQVQAGLSSGGPGVPSLIADLVAEVRNNRLDDPDIEQRMDALTQKLTALGLNALPTASSELARSLKLAEMNADDEPTSPGELPSLSDEDAPNRVPRLIEAPKTPRQQELSTGLQTAGNAQEKILSELQAMLDELAPWDDARRFRNEVRHLETAQKQLADETVKLVPETLTKTWDELTPEQQARLKQQAQKQNDLARKLGKTLADMDRARQDLPAKEVDLSQALQDAVTMARRQALENKMRNASGQLEKNQVGQAAAQQRHVADALRNLADQLAQRPERDLARLLKQLKETQTELNNVQEEQARLRKQMEAAARQPAPNPTAAEAQKRELQRLSRQQAQVQAEAERLSRQLQRLQANQADQAAKKAAQAMQGAGQDANQGSGKQAAQQAQQAERDLESAAKALDDRIRQVEAELAFEEALKMQDQLASVKERQDQLLSDTQRLEKLKQEQGERSAAQRTSVQDLATAQQLLEAEARELAQKLTPAQVFHLAMERAASEMQHAADLLKDDRTEKIAQTAQQNAARRLAQLLEALQPEPPDPNQKENNGQGGEGKPGNNQPPADLVSRLAQLKLLKLMQVEVNGRTLELETALGARAELTEDEQREYLRLGQEQGRLADLIRDLAEAQGPEPEPDPDLMTEPARGPRPSTDDIAPNHAPGEGQIP